MIEMSTQGGPSASEGEEHLSGLIIGEPPQDVFISIVQSGGKVLCVDGASLVDADDQ